MVKVVSYGFTAWKSSNRTGLMSGLMPYNSLREDENSIFISSLYGIYLVYKEMKDG